jgi:hypothetical protein
MNILKKGSDHMKYNPEEWYTPPQALERLSMNSGGKKIHESYLRTLAKVGKIERLKIADKYSLYKKSDIDGYIVVGRGQKWSTGKRKPSEEHRDKEVA